MSRQTISISRTTTSHGPDFISIRIRLGDGRFVVVDVTPESFAYAITGRAETPCGAKMYQRGNREEESP